MGFAHIITSSSLCTCANKRFIEPPKSAQIVSYFRHYHDLRAKIGSNICELHHIVSVWHILQSRLYSHSEDYKVGGVYDEHSVSYKSIIRQGDVSNGFI